jgi:hypothetical protein
MRSACLVILLLATPPARAAELTLRAEPATVVLGVDREATVHADGTPRWSASIGVIDEHGRWTPGDRRAPGIAIVAAAQGDARAAITLPLVGRGELPTQTLPGAHVSVEVEGKRFGPVTADRQGRAVVTVDVPPGITEANVIAIDREGRQTTRPIALPSQPYPRGLIVAPDSLTQGTRGAVTLFAIDEHGGWRDAAAPPPEITSGPGLIVRGPPTAVAPGRWEIAIEATGSADTATLTASVDGAPLEPVTIRMITSAAPARTRHLSLGVRAGAVTSFGPMTSAAATGEIGLTFGALSIAFEGGITYGTSTASRDETVSATFSTSFFDVAAGVNAQLSTRARLILQAGLGMVFASSSLSDATPDSLLVVLGGAFAYRLGPGEAVCDLRWMGARFDESVTRVAGSRLGAALSLGYRLRF